MLDQPQSQHLELEISQLEARLHDLRAQLDTSTFPTHTSPHYNDKNTSWTAPSGECIQTDGICAAHTNAS